MIPPPLILVLSQGFGISIFGGHRDFICACLTSLVDISKSHDRSSAAVNPEVCSSKGQLVKQSQHLKQTHSIVQCVEDFPIVHLTVPPFEPFLLRKSVR